jgi:hypothetical protein
MKKYISFVLIAVLFAACTPNNEVGTPFKAGQEVSITAHMPNAGANYLPGKQRVSGKDAGTQIDLTWDADDQITVKVGDATAVFTLESGAGSASATFTGTMPAAGSTYQVSYPVSYDESVLANQTYVENGFGKGLMKMSTKSDGTLDGGFVLSADNALVAFNFTGEDALSKIVLTNPAASKNYTLGCTGVTLNSVAKVFYFVIPAGTWPDGFTVEVYDAGGNVINSFTKEGAVDFSATSAVDMPEKEVEAEKEPTIGIFSVSATKKVNFSPGNLQYTQSTSTWSFAENQYDYIGTDNVTGGSVSTDTWGDSKPGTALADKIDLFGWSTSANNFGITTSTMSEDYFGSFVDWGTNIIGSDAPNTWRTLTYDEWEYLLNTRPNASSLKGVAQVNGVNGLVFLPDNWTCPSGVTFTPGFYSEYSVEAYGQHQTFTAEQWSKLESAGAVFLPAAGYRSGSNVPSLWMQRNGCYRSATGSENYKAYYLYFTSGEASMGNSGRNGGYSVRLVKDL